MLYKFTPVNTMFIHYTHCTVCEMKGITAKRCVVLSEVPVSHICKSQMCSSSLSCFRNFRHSPGMWLLCQWWLSSVVALLLWLHEKKSWRLEWRYSVMTEKLTVLLNRFHLNGHTLGLETLEAHQLAMTTKGSKYVQAINSDKTNDTTLISNRILTKDICELYIHW